MDVVSIVASITDTIRFFMFYLLKSIYNKQRLSPPQSDVPVHHLHNLYFIICFAYSPGKFPYSPYPFTAPIIMPFTKYFWKNGYTIMIGSTTITVIVIRMLVAVCVVAAAAASELELLVFASADNELA